MPRRISDEDGRAALARWAATESPDRATTGTAVRWTLTLLSEAAPGRSVEVRVPPFGAVQCVEGPVHTRGTPPAVVETDAATWLRLAAGQTAWADAQSAGALRTSGNRTDLSAHLPLRAAAGSTS
ncbi:hypothetical protein EEW87_013880 [Janibacter melonis]|uniref:Bacterial SCP orthologue domain-containing protein n=1 Tax=Janibacter melonis TaxID=262209 RepID=A0A5P8FQC4_9MICO|nr:sterol carrier family protein [Janibacter melonis]QFQ31786.2 hypothetical protein EEW87_013880 [Janibacter melonis]